MGQNKNPTNLSMDAFSEGTEFCSNSTYFQVENEFQQNFGVSMRSPISASIANSFMEHSEQSTSKDLSYIVILY